MKEKLAENEKYTVYQTSKRILVAENKPGHPFFRGKFNLRKEATTYDATMILKFLCPDKKSDESSPGA